MYPVELSWSMEIISVSPELNPKVKGNLRFEQVCVITPIFSLSWSMKKVKRYNNQARSIFEVFCMTRVSIYIFYFLNINIII